MKIIVSSDYFCARLKLAFENQSNYIKASDMRTEISFVNELTGKEVVLQCEKQRQEDKEVVRFDNVGLAKLYFFLKSIKNQPVTIILNFETIRVQHAVIDFS